MAEERPTSVPITGNIAMPKSVTRYSGLLYGEGVNFKTASSYVRLIWYTITEWRNSSRARYAKSRWHRGSQTWTPPGTASVAAHKHLKLSWLQRHVRFRRGIAYIHRHVIDRRVGYESSEHRRHLLAVKFGITASHKGKPRVAAKSMMCRMESAGTRTISPVSFCVETSPGCLQLCPGE